MENLIADYQLSNFNKINATISITLMSYRIEHVYYFNAKIGVPNM